MKKFYMMFAAFIIAGILALAPHDAIHAEGESDATVAAEVAEPAAVEAVAEVAEPVVAEPATVETEISAEAAPAVSEVSELAPHTVIENGKEVARSEGGELNLVPDEPEQPETPEQPEKVVPEVPETVVPEQPEKVVPEVPETVVPEQPQSETPEQPEKVVPEVPETVVPEQLETVIPVIPDQVISVADAAQPMEAAPVVPLSPRTGDDSMMVMFGIMMMTCAVGLVVMSRKHMAF